MKNGFFTLSLLEALDSNDPKADADGDGSLMFAEVVKYVTARTNELAFDYYGKSQKPNLCGSIADFPLLDELRIGGLTVGERERADGLYREGLRVASRSAISKRA